MFIVFTQFLKKIEKRLLTNRQLPVSCKNNKFNFRIVERNEMK